MAAVFIIPCIDDNSAVQYSKKKLSLSSPVQWEDEEGKKEKKEKGERDVDSSVDKNANKNVLSTDLSTAGCTGQTPFLLLIAEQ